MKAPFLTGMAAGILLSILALIAVLYAIESPPDPVNTNPTIHR